MTDGRSAEFYARAGKQHDCLESHGFITPDVPSLATYRSNWDAYGDFRYDPYGFLSKQELIEAITACPQGKEP